MDRTRTPILRDSVRTSVAPLYSPSVALDRWSITEVQELPIVRLADQAGVSRGYLRAVLRGQKSATIDYVARLAEALEYDPGVLLGDKRITRRTRRKKR